MWVKVWPLDAGVSSRRRHMPSPWCALPTSKRPVAFSPTTVAAASANESVHVWDATSGAVRAVLPRPGPVTAVAFGRDGRTLATAAADGVTRLWALPTPSSPVSAASSGCRRRPPCPAIRHHPASTLIADTPTAGSPTAQPDLDQAAGLPLRRDQVGTTGLTCGDGGLRPV
jgi:WD40 repeat protein